MAIVSTVDTAPAAPAAPRARVNTQDTISVMLVIIVTLVALIAGLLLRNSVESRTQTYTDPALAGVSLVYPDGWRVNTAAADQGIVGVRDMSAKGFPTLFEFRRVAVDSSAPMTGVLSLVANDLAATRARDLTAFKLFSVTPGQTIKGLPGVQVRYVFVSTPAGVLQESVPTVVLGDDYLVRKGNMAYVFTLHAADENRAEALPLFEKFVDASQLP